jgi:hypothetical protein
MYQPPLRTEYILLALTYSVALAVLPNAPRKAKANFTVSGENHFIRIPST